MIEDISSNIGTENLGITIAKNILKNFELHNIPINSDIPLYLYFNSKKPQFAPHNINNTQKDIIYLNMSNDGFENNILDPKLLPGLIYELSHELCHYTIYLQDTSAYWTNYIAWIEESICEALSFYWLNKYSIIFKKPSYSEELVRYLNYKLNEGFNIDLSTYNKEQLSILNLESQKDNGRYTRRLFVKTLYMYINDNIINSLVNYQKFLKDDLLVDTIKYKQKYNNVAVQYICSIQDKIERNL